MIPTLSVQSNVAEVAKRLQIEQRDLAKRVATALSRTAVEIKKGLQAEMRSVFDRPTPYTLNSVFVKPATASDLKAVVWLKERDVFGGPHYLEPQILGGPRPLKPFEKRLQRAGILPTGMYAVPGALARLDSYGNISRGQIVQILSQLRTFTEAGYDAHPTGSRRSRRNAKRAGKFFAGRPGNGRGPLGIWQRTSAGLRPVLIFVRSPRYSRRFRFHEVSERIARARFPLQLERAEREARARRAMLRAL